MDFKQFLLLGSVAGTLTACGGDSSSKDSVDEGYGIDYKGLESAIVLSEDNASAIGNNVHSAVGSLLSPVDGEPAFLALDSNADKLVDSMKAFSDTIYSELGTESIPNVPLEGDCGGSVSAQGDYKNFSFSASDYCEPIDRIEVTANGSGSFTTNSETNYQTFSFKNFSLSVDDVDTPKVSITGDVGAGQNEKDNEEIRIYADMTIGNITQSTNMVRACGLSNCDYDIEFSVLDGLIIKITDLSYTQEGNSINGFGKIFLPEQGKVSFEYNDVTLCLKGIATGRIDLIDQGSNTVSMTYSQCGVEPSITFSEAISEF